MSHRQKDSLQMKRASSLFFGTKIKTGRGQELV